MKDWLDVKGAAEALGLVVSVKGLKHERLWSRAIR